MTRPLRIALIAVTYMHSGTEQIQLELGARLVGDGHNVSIVIPGLAPLDSMAADASALGVRVVRTGDLYGSGRSVAGNLRQLYGFFRQARPDIAHFHIPWAPVGVESVAAAWLARVPHIVRTEHNPVVLPLAKAQRLKLRVLDAMVERIVFVSEGNMRSHLANAGRPARKSIVVTNGIPVTASNTPPSAGDRAAMRRQLGLPADAPVAVMVASLQVRKGPLDFVRAAALAAPAVPSLHFAIVGDGEARAETERLAASLGLGDRLHMLGRRDDVPAILPCFDLYVQPSHYEGMSLAMLEALAAGLPMVTTRVDGVADVLPDERGALFVDIGDAAGLADGIVRLATDPALGAELAAIAQSRVQKEFSTDAMYRRYRDLYLSLTGRTKTEEPRVA